MTFDRSHHEDDEVDDAYQRYLWGDEPTRGFARSRRAARREPRRKIAIEIDAAFDPADFVQR